MRIDHYGRDKPAAFGRRTRIAALLKRSLRIINSLGRKRNIVERTCGLYVRKFVTIGPFRTMNCSDANDPVRSRISTAALVNKLGKPAAVSRFGFVAQHAKAAGLPKPLARQFHGRQPAMPPTGGIDACSETQVDYF